MSVCVCVCMRDREKKADRVGVAHVGQGYIMLVQAHHSNACQRGGQSQLIYFQFFNSQNSGS